VAQRCLHLICQQQIEHGFSPVSNLLSLSLGVGTHIVTPNSAMLGFVESVDKLLYQAKHNGRMRAEFAEIEV
jgi:PleD family two-component response regulator